MIDFILKSFPDAQASPSYLSSRSFDLSAYAGVTDATIPPGSLLAWCHALSDAFSDTQQQFARRIKDGKVCHTLLPTLNRFERVSNSPTQGKELKPNLDVLDLLRNRVPDNRHVPLSLRGCCFGTVSQVRPRVSQLSHLVGGCFDPFPVREETSAQGRPSYLPVAEVFLQGLRQRGFLHDFVCCLRHPEEETASPLPCGAFSLRRAEKELALGPFLPD